MNLEGFNCNGMWFIPVLFCLAAFLIFRNNKGFNPFDFIGKDSSASYKDEGSSLKLLNNRYAKGEISKSEYEAIKKDLET